MPVLSPFVISLALPALLPIRGAAQTDQQSDAMAELQREPHAI